MRKGKFRIKNSSMAILSALVLLSAQSAYALTISEDFTKDRTTNNWLMPVPGGGGDHAESNDACLTASNQSSTATPTVPGSPGQCSNIKDSNGRGALRLTMAYWQRVGGIVSADPFPTNEGVDITFTTYTYGGNGADGMTFFIADADRPPTLGASGGSLGYQCTNLNPLYSGVDGGYFGIGIDEFGNFVSQNDNTSTGLWRIPNIIGIRGAGQINADYLSKQFLQDVYTARGWGTVPLSKMNAWAELWRKDVSNRFSWWIGDWWGNYSNRAHMMWRTCQTGQLTVGPEFLPAGQSELTFSDTATDPKLKLYNYKYLTHKKVPETLWSDVPTRDQATPILYKIKITPSNVASVWYSYNGGTYQPVLLNQDLTATNGPLPRAFRFGFVASTGGWYNNHEVTCFKAAPGNESQGSLNVNSPDAQVMADTQVYLSMYSPTYWTGQLLAREIVRTPTPDGKFTYSVSATANWDAACKLNGGDCKDTNTTVTRQAARKFFTWNGGGIPLDWADLSAAQRNSLKSPAETDAKAQQRLDYLKGDRSQEQTHAGHGLFRVRKSVLGDIINSSPAWVGYPSAKYNRAWTDKRNNTTGPETGYATFKAANLNRTNVVYVGANDGFLHAFRSGHYTSENSFDKSDNDGHELFAYMPSSVLARIHNKTNSSLDYSHSQFAHNFYNDATPATGDVFYKGQWHTWLLSGLGTGGNTMYALDITNPDNFQKTNVIGEWSGVDGGVWSNLGNTYGTPVFGRFHDGNWGAVFGNGWCSNGDEANGNCKASAGPAGIYVMTVDQTTGTPGFKFISTGVSGTKNKPNGIAYVTPTDIDGDMIYDYAYAGDLAGNVWRFDLTDLNSGRVQKIFTTQSNQPISTQILVAKSKTNSDVLLSFGTGLRQEGYLGAETKYMESTQSFYGLRDREVAAFPTHSGHTARINISDLQKNVIGAPGRVDTGSGIRETNQLSTASLNSNKLGWYMDLRTVTLANGDKKYEQIIYNPYMKDDTYLITNSYIDGSSPLLSCDTVNSTGYTYPLKNESGAGISGFFKKGTGAIAAQYNANGTSTILRAKLPNGETKTLMLYKQSDGSTGVQEVNFSEGVIIRRLSWREIF